MSDAIHAFGTLLKRAGTTVAERVEITAPNLQRNDIEVTHHDSPSGFREYIAGLAEPDAIGLTVNWTDAASQTQVRTDFMDKTKSLWTLQWPDGDTWACSGYVNGFQMQPPIDGALRAQIGIKLTGVPTFA